MRFILLMIVPFLGLAGGARAQDAASGCTGAPPDSTWLSAGPIYRDCEVDTPAVQEDEGPRYPNGPFIQLRLGRPCLHIIMDVVVEPNGRVNRDQVRVVSSDHPVMTEETLKTLRGVRFTPAVKDGQPVRQLARYARSVRLDGMAMRIGRVGRPPPSQPPMQNC